MNINMILMFLIENVMINMISINYHNSFKKHKNNTSCYNYIIINNKILITRMIIVDDHHHHNHYDYS